MRTEKNIIHWEPDSIDQPLITHLMNNELHCPSMPNMRSGLMKIYMRYKRLGVHFLKHLWVAYADFAPVGVALIEDDPNSQYDVPLFQIYVKPSYRIQGIGRALVQHAVDSGQTFGAYYTVTSCGLYKHFGLINLCKKAATIYDLAS